ncbi:MAG TPA: P-II family nitrogen regulator [Fibrobacteraceae bacterium]|nr:P-II family nitrogen regulator [Fibrobacteraceae bacterium]
MKLITAIIQEDKLDDVHEALLNAEIERITVSRVSGHGQQQEITVLRGKKVMPNLIPKIQITIACNDQYEDTIVDTVLRTARHGKDGKIGDGKIFVQELKECVRIRTGERGIKAI